MSMTAWVRAVALGMVLSVAGTLPSLAATKVTVNGIPISDTQIQQRARLFTLEGNQSGNRGATEQLIEEAIKMAEANRLGIAVSESEIDTGFVQIARNLELSPDKLTQLLQQGGVSVGTLKDRLRAAIAWNGVTETAIASQVQISDLQLDQQAEAGLNEYQNFDYILKEVIFVAPGGQGAGGRTSQANRYRASFAGCDSAVQLSLGYTDAAVIDVGRRHATQMPEALARELAGLNVGGITKPRVTDQGVSMLAVCQKAQAEDLTFVKNDLRAEAGAEAMKSQAETYLANLRSQAKIIYN